MPRKLRLGRTGDKVEEEQEQLSVQSFTSIRLLLRGVHEPESECGEDDGEQERAAFEEEWKTHSAIWQAFKDAACAFNCVSPFLCVAFRPSSVRPHCPCREWSKAGKALDAFYESVLGADISR